MKIATNIQRTDITFGKVFCIAFRIDFSPQNHDSCSRSNASGRVTLNPKPYQEVLSSARLSLRVLVRYGSWSLVRPTEV